MKNISKTVLITGGLGGIGLELVSFFFEKNFNVIILDNKKIDYFKNLKINKIKKNNFIVYKKINLINSHLVKKLFINLIQKHNKIDVLINCAGIQYVSKIEHFPDHKWNEIININLSSFFYTIKNILPLMKSNKWGRIINISSVHGLVASIDKSAYVASKHGIIGLTKTIALETATLPITVNAICPGWVNTPLVSKQIQDKVKINKSNKEIETKKLLITKHPNLKFIPGKAIASLAFYLCSEEASEITGASINIDGGWISQ